MGLNANHIISPFLQGIHEHILSQLVKQINLGERSNTYLKYLQTTAEHRKTSKYRNRNMSTADESSDISIFSSLSTLCSSL